MDIHRKIEAMKLRTSPARFQQQLQPFRAWTSRRGTFAGMCNVITSMSPNPARLARQMTCIQSWIDIGLNVICLNTQAEIAQLYFPPGVTPLASDDVSTSYDRPTQRVSALINAGIQTGLPFFLVNADIEINGHTQVIAAALAEMVWGPSRIADSKLTIGIRYNYDEITEPQIEQWGLDLFGMTPDMARTLPQMPFGIGKPMWDYWLPLHFRERGVGFHWIREPFLFHKSHAIQWSDDEWKLGATVMESTYGYNMMENCLQFRQSLEPCCSPILNRYGQSTAANN